MELLKLEIPESWETGPTPLLTNQILEQQARAKNEVMRIEDAIKTLEAKYKKSHPRDPATRDLATEPLRADLLNAMSILNLADAQVKFLNIWQDLFRAYGWATRKM